jgi:tetratricopeptide (TPR) repeat protein
MRYKNIFLLIVIAFLSIVIDVKANIINLPNQNENFVRRNEYEILLDEYLKSKESAVVIQGVCGIGKTQIAKSYAYSKKDNYDFIWWINSKSSFKSQIEDMIDFYKKTQSKEVQIYKTGNIEIDIITAYKIISDNKKWLIIFDDYQLSLSEHMDNFIQKLKKNGSVDILVTTRDKFVEKKLSKMINITQYKREESLRYLKRLDTKKYKGGVEKLDKLALLLNDHPLSIACAYAYISSISGIDVDDYIALYQSRYKELKKVEQKVVENIGNKHIDNYSKTVNTVIDVILEQIKKEDKEAIELIKLISLVDNKKIPNEILHHYLESNKLKYSQAINTLLKYGLLEIDGEFYECHEEVQRAFYYYFDTQELKDTCVKVISLLNNELPETVHLLNLYLTNKVYYLNHIEKIYKKSDKLNYRGDDIIRLKIRELEFVLTGIRDGDRAKTIIQEIQELIRNNKGINDLNKIKFLLMKSTYRSWFAMDYDLAIKQINEALTIIRKEADKYKGEKMMALSKLAQIYSLKGDYKKVFSYAEQAKDLMNDNDISVGTKRVMHGIISMAYRHIGDYKKALEEINKSIFLSSDTINKYDKGYTNPIYVLRNKLKIMMKLGDNLEALSKISEMEERIEKSYGNSAPQLLNIIYVLKAEALFNLYKIKEATENIQKVDFLLENQDSNVAKSILWTASAYKLKGDIYRVNKKYDEAFKYFLQAEEIYKKYLSVIEIEDVSDLYVSMVLNLLDCNEINRAFKYKKLHEELFGDTHAGHYKMELYLTKKTAPDNFKNID